MAADAAVEVRSPQRLPLAVLGLEVLAGLAGGVGADRPVTQRVAGAEVARLQLVGAAALPANVVVPGAHGRDGGPAGRRRRLLGIATTDAA